MELAYLPKNKKIILFDGVCNFCNGIINTIIKKDKKNIFVFAALQSETGRQIARQIGLPAELDTIVFYEPGKRFKVKSEAAMEIAKNIGGIYALLGLGYLLPKAWRDRLYDHIAKNRYQRYGKKDSCMVPDPEVKAKFL